jgi:uncharacterized damage-inducible protein DinB
MQCNSRKFPGVLVTYKPNASFTGEDQFGLDVIWPNGNSVKQNNWALEPRLIGTKNLMIGTGYVKCMARYNRWQNDNLYSCADRLTDEARRQERGAFLGSIHGTLNHLLWADEIWMSRFWGTPRPKAGIPESSSLRANWDELKRDRVAFDERIIEWGDEIDDIALAGDFTYYSGAAKRDLTKPKWLLITHVFNHQTHHRGQVHCMLTQAGIRPGDTDLPFLRDQAA